MAIAFDAASRSGTGFSPTSNPSWSHTCTGSQRFLVVSLHTRGFGSSGLTATATYGGQAMTNGPEANMANANNGKTISFYLPNPPSGSNTISISMSTSLSCIGLAVSYTGAQQITGLDATAANSPTDNTSFTQTITTIAATTWYVWCGVTEDPGTTISFTGGATNRNNSNANDARIADSNGDQTAGAHNITGNLSANNEIAMVSLSFTVASAPFTPSPMMHMMQAAGGLL